MEWDRVCHCNACTCIVTGMNTPDLCVYIVLYTCTVYVHTKNTESQHTGKQS